MHSQGLCSLSRSVPAPSGNSAPQAFPTWGSALSLLHMDPNMASTSCSRFPQESPTKHLCAGNSGSLRRFWLIQPPTQLAHPKRGRGTITGSSSADLSETAEIHLPVDRNASLPRVGSMKGGQGTHQANGGDPEHTYTHSLLSAITLRTLPSLSLAFIPCTHSHTHCYQDHPVDTTFLWPGILHTHSLL